MKKRHIQEIVMKRILIVHWCEAECIAAGRMLKGQYIIDFATNETAALKMIRAKARRKSPYNMVLVSEEMDKQKSGLAYTLIFTSSLYKMCAAVIHINLNVRFITVLNSAMRVVNLDIPRYKQHAIKRMFECGAHYDWTSIVDVFMQYTYDEDKLVRRKRYTKN